MALSIPNSHLKNQSSICIFTRIKLNMKMETTNVSLPICV